ncbi:hypothetical protein ATI61_107610 [Archangium gephyra]|nr:hypothetical protein [Archangium gephyra]REG29913.1 hypothetical protein ATI61_107610 [Archangium gephyra]
MSTVQKPCLLVLVGALASACATPGAPREPSQFKAWPSKPPGCAFDFFEADVEPSEPSRPYDVLGTLAFEGNQWMGQEGRKEALRETACKAGADVVLVSRPFERGFGKQIIRSYDVRFAVYTDVPPPPEVQAEREAAREKPPPRRSPDTVVIPAPSWEQDVEGTAVIKKQ